MWVGSSSKLRFQEVDLGLQTAVGPCQILDVLVLSLHCVCLVLQRACAVGDLLLDLLSQDSFSLLLVATEKMLRHVL